VDTSAALKKNTRDAHERAQRARAQARSSAEVAWRRRCDALALIMWAGELAPPLRLTLPPDSSALKRLRKLVRDFARGRGADTEAVILATHQAVEHTLVGNKPTTEPIDVELRKHRAAVELRVQARMPAPDKSWQAYAHSPLRRIAQLADHLNVRYLDENQIEIRASFVTTRP
jgi:hypothetical protein